MDHVFVALGSQWDTRGGLLLRAANRILRRRARVTLQPLIDPSVDMSTTEQRMNLVHLAEQVLAYRVPGDFVEFGTFTGESAFILAKVLLDNGSNKVFHCYDSFEHSIGESRPPKEVLRRRFEQGALPFPELHEGRFEDTVPAELPARIAFINIDCGWGGPPDEHSRIVEHLLRHAWPRLSAGGILLMTDYCDPDRHPPDGTNPGVKMACDRFFGTSVKPGQLWGGGYTQGYLRKPLDGD